MRGKLCCIFLVWFTWSAASSVEHVGSAFTDNFKPRFKVHKSDFISEKNRCGVTKQFLNKCSDGNKVENIEV